MTTDQTISALTIPEQIWLWLRLHMMDIAGAFAVLIIGLLLAGIISRWVERAMTRSSRFEPTVANFLSSVVKYALWALVLVTVLAQFGVETTSILAALGGMALAVGLALQGVDLEARSFQGAVPIGPAALITACDGNLVRELDGRPVDAVLGETIARVAQDASGTNLHSFNISWSTYYTSSCCS